MNLKCVKCIEDFIELDQDDRERILTNENEFDMAVNNAVTIVPSWQQSKVGDQLLMACVSVPICMEHLIPADKVQQPVVSKTGLITA